MLRTSRWGRPSAQAREERERALGLAWDVPPPADVEATPATPAAQPSQPALRAEHAPVPATPLEAEVERLERAMAEAWARWDALEGRPSGRVTQAEVDAAWAYKRALEAYETAVARLRAQQETGA